MFRNDIYLEEEGKMDVTILLFQKYEHFIIIAITPGTI